jgi:hypothetical protein
MINTKKEIEELCFCLRCHAKIAKIKHDEAIKKNWIPLCEKCEPEIQEKIKKWQPLFQKFKL